MTLTMSPLQLSQQAGFPPGVINVITCSQKSTPAVGEAMTGSELVGKLSFTGSTAVGKVRSIVALTIANFANIMCSIFGVCTI